MRIEDRRTTRAGDGSDIRERTFRFACDVIGLHEALVQHGGTARDIGRQLMRAATSVGANLEEADAAQSKPDFISKCTIALKEAREAHYWLRLLKATAKIDERFEPLLSEGDRIVAVLTTIVKKSKGAQ